MVEPEEPLEKILSDHKEWIVSEGNKGRQADLTERKLRWPHLRGADLTGVKLPQEFDEATILNIINESTKNARKILLSLLLGCSYSFLTIAATTDERLLTNSSSSPLPIIGTEIPIAFFYWFAPIILVLFFVYLHFYLRRLWEGFSDLPYKFPDGKRLDQRAYPWILNSIVRRHFDLGKKELSIFNKSEEWVSIFLAWWALPLTLIFFWLRYLPRHEWIGTGFHIILIGLSSFIGIRFYREMVRVLRGNPNEAIRRKRFYKDGRAIQYGGSALLVIFFLALSLGTIEGIGRGGTSTDMRTWCPWVFGQIKYNVFAELNGTEVSKRPENYWQISKEERNEAVEGAHLRNADLRYSSLANAFLVRAHLMDANLQGAYLANANLEESTLIGTNLTEAILSGANLQRARLVYANLWKASLGGVDARGADFSLANLISAKLGKADLSASKFWGGVALCGADLEEANLKNAFLEESLLERANLKNTNLEGANLKNANLGGSLLENANFKNANLDGANLKDAILKGAILQGTDMTKVKGLKREQVELAIMDSTTRLPNYLKGSGTSSDVYSHPLLLLCPEKDDGIIRKILR